MINIAANDINCSPFGQYMCLVNNSVTTMTTSFLLRQKGDNCLYVDHTVEYANPLCTGTYPYQVNYKLCWFLGVPDSVIV